MLQCGQWNLLGRCFLAETLLDADISEANDPTEWWPEAAAAVTAATAALNDVAEATDGNALKIGSIVTGDPGAKSDLLAESELDDDSIDKLFEDGVIVVTVVDPFVDDEEVVDDVFKLSELLLEGSSISDVHALYSETASLGSLLSHGRKILLSCGVMAVLNLQLNEKCEVKLS